MYTAGSVQVLIIALALSLDLLVGEPGDRLHPVRWYGAAAEVVGETSPRVASVALVVLTLVFSALGYALTALPLSYSRVAGVAVASVVLFSCLSLRSLLSTAAEVSALSVTDPDRARSLLPSLVGRDPDRLSPAEVRSAAVESAAENLSDGFVAPLLAFALASLLSVPAGVAAAVWVKAVNTNDSMYGYPDDPSGGPSARLDDLVMYLPSRVTSLLLLVASAHPPDAEFVGSSRRPSSPNAGWPVAAVAVGVGVRLTKPGHYDMNRDAPLPSADDARLAVRRVGVAAALFSVSVLLGHAVIATLPGVGA